MPGYYDIDEILAEEVLVPCKTSFTFSFLANLDPDNDTYDNNDSTIQQSRDNGYLPEGSIIQMPVWAIRKWADLNFIRLGIPKQYRLKSRERYEADPTATIGGTNTSYGNERNTAATATTNTTSISNLKYTQYFECGKVLCDLIDTCCTKVTTDIKASLARSRTGRLDRSNAKQIRDINELQIECNKVRLFLYTLYKCRGRLGLTMDWSLSCYGDDDVSTYSSKITMFEQRLFYVGAIAVTNHHIWKLYNNPRLLLSSPSTSIQNISFKTIQDKTKSTNNRLDVNTNGRRALQNSTINNNSAKRIRKQ
jgi:hypothetical protein